MAAISDGSAILERYEYDVYGKCTVHTSAGEDEEWMTEDDDVADYSVCNPFLFTGRQLDSETGLYYYRARHYHPEIGRFMQADPIALFMQYASVQQPKEGKIAGMRISQQAMFQFSENNPIGRFLQMNPSIRFANAVQFGFLAELNLYTYCGNNPLNWLDPWGLSKVPFGVKMIVGGGIACGLGAKVIGVGGHIAHFVPQAGGVIMGIGLAMVVLGGAAMLVGGLSLL